MIGLINTSVKQFIIDVYGLNQWERVLEADPLGFGQPFFSQCPFSDELTVGYAVLCTGMLKMIGCVIRDWQA